MQILLVDDHALFREGLVHVLKRLKRGVRVIQAGTFQQALEKACEPGIDLVLLDAMLPDQQGLQGLKTFRRRFPKLPVLMISAYEEASMQRRALSLGAAGFLPKSAGSAEMLSALRQVFSKAKPARQADAMGRNEGLTQRQLEVLSHLSQGRSNKEIAQALKMAPNTVRTHLLSVYKALGVNSRTQAALKAVQQGLISIER